MNRSIDLGDALVEAAMRRGEWYVAGNITETTLNSANLLLPVLDKALPKSKPLKVIISSGGGAIVYGLGVYDRLMEISKHRKIHTVAVGPVMSMAMILMQIGDKRFSYPNASFLLHELSGGSHGKLSDQQADMAESIRIQAVLDNIVATRTGLSPAELKKKLKGPDWYLTPVDAMRLHLIDKIL